MDLSLIESDSQTTIPLDLALCSDSTAALDVITSIEEDEGDLLGDSDLSDEVDNFLDSDTEYESKEGKLEAGQDLLHRYFSQHSIYNDEIEHYIENGYKTVALGSTQITDFGTLAYVVEKFKGTKIKLHLFGNANFEFLTSFPIYSCDASTWAMAGKFGDIKWWNPNKMTPNKTDKIYIEEYIPSRPNVKLLSEYEYRHELLEYLYVELGVTENDLLGLYGTYFKQIVNLHYYLKFEEVVNQIHRQKGF